MKRLLSLFVSLVLFVSLTSSGQAQSGACPGETILAGAISGSYPDETIACYHLTFLSTFLPETNDSFPCGVAMRWDHRIVTGQDAERSELLFYVPPAAWYYGQTPRVRFIVSTYPNDYALTPAGADDLDLATLGIYYYADENGYYSSQRRVIGQYTKITSWGHSLLIGRDYFNAYLVDELLLADTPAGGMFGIDVTYGDNEHVDFTISSVSISAYGDAVPDYCPIPNAVMPQPTVYPSPTFEATWTPGAATPTVITTPYPTAVSGTVYPTSTPTPFTFVTVPAENTPTAISPLQLPTLRFSTPEMPVIPTLEISGGGGATVVPGSVPDLGDGIELMVTRWYTSTQLGIGLDDTIPITETGDSSAVVFQGPYAPSASIPSYDGSFSSAIMRIPAMFGMVIGFIKMPFALMPHFTVFLVGIYIFLAVILFTLMLKYGLRIGLAVINWIIRIIELIPGL